MSKTTINMQYAQYKEINDLGCGWYIGKHMANHVLILLTEDESIAFYRDGTISSVCPDELWIDKMVNVEINVKEGL